MSSIVRKIEEHLAEHGGIKKYLEALESERAKYPTPRFPTGGVGKAYWLTADEELVCINPDTDKELVNEFRAALTGKPPLGWPPVDSNDFRDKIVDRSKEFKIRMP